MNMRNLFLNFGKLMLCSLTFILGAVIGSLIAALLGLDQPPMPEGVDSLVAFLLLCLTSPLLVLVLAQIARELGGGLLPRALTISFFTWVTYTLNTVIESMAFTTTTVEGALFTMISFLVPCTFVGSVVALLFPSGEKAEGLMTMVGMFFTRRPIGGWIWRIAVAALAFVPIYLFFGSLVVPLTAQYYQEGMYGLRMPGQAEIFLVLLVRSLLFLLTCLPIIILWRGSKWSLFLNLAIAIFVLVGFLYMLGAYYMPLAVRIPHTVEILADSFAYAGILTILLVHRSIYLDQARKLALS